MLKQIFNFTNTTSKAINIKQVKIAKNAKRSTNMSSEKTWKVAMKIHVKWLFSGI